MAVRTLISFIFVAAVCVTSSWAQLAAPNEAGVSTGHIHLHVHDVEAHKKFWLAMGGTPTKYAQFEVMKFPDVLVFLAKDEPTGGSAGSIVNHVGFRVPDGPAAIAKWKEAGLKTEAGRNPRGGYLIAPDDLRVEIVEDTSMKTPIAFHHVHFWVSEAAIPEIKAWYVKTFGAKPGKRGDNEAADVPGANLTFSKAVERTAPAKGTVLDHIGFEIKNLEAFCKRLEASGVKFDRPYSKSPAGLGLAFFTDPWGTYIEVTEGLDKL
ncbi:MAG: VOC family protein [Acidobacteria bacterium]|nr:VOC family protein [Acidobacteriota bacterium]